MRSLTIILTDKCNLKCTYCYLKEMGSKRYIDPETLKSIIVWFFKQAISINEKELNFVFFGGEPILAFPRIKEAVLLSKSLAKNLGINVTFVTISNGTLINNEVLDFFIEHEITLQLSIDGDSESHNEHRITKSHKGSHDYIQWLPVIPQYIANGLNLSANLVYTAHTSYKLFHNFQYLNNLGFKSIRLRPVTGCFDQWNSSILKEQINHILEFWLTDKSLNLYPFSNYFANEKRSCSDQERDLEVVCNLADLQFTVDMNGDLFPCHRFRYHVDYQTFNFGNVVNNTIDTNKIKNFLSYRPRKDGGCSKCPFKYFCDVQCVYAFYEKNKNLTKPDPQLCEVSKIVWGTFLEKLTNQNYMSFLSNIYH